MGRFRKFTFFNIEKQGVFPDFSENGSWLFWRLVFIGVCNFDPKDKTLEVVSVSVVSLEAVCPLCASLSSQVRCLALTPLSVSIPVRHSSMSLLSVCGLQLGLNLIAQLTLRLPSDWRQTVCRAMLLNPVIPLGPNKRNFQLHVYCQTKASSHRTSSGKTSELLFNH